MYSPVLCHVQFLSQVFPLFTLDPLSALCLLKVNGGLFFVYLCCLSLCVPVSQVKGVEGSFLACLTLFLLFVLLILSVDKSPTQIWLATSGIELHTYGFIALCSTYRSFSNQICMCCWLGWSKVKFNRSTEMSKTWQRISVSSTLLNTRLIFV